MKKFQVNRWAGLAAGLVLAGLSPAGFAQKTLADLPVFFGGSSRMNARGEVELITYFNEIAHPDDGYFFMESSLLRNPANHLAAIKQVRQGHIIQNFASWRTASQHIAALANRVDMIQYDLEHWPQSEGEHQDIESASTKMALLAAGYNLFYVAHLSNRLATRNPNDPRSIEHMTACADAYNAVAYACLELFPMDRCITDMGKMIERAKSANPDIEIRVGVSVEKNVRLADLYQYLKGNLDRIDGVTIFAFPNRPGSVQRLKDFIALLRGGTPGDLDDDGDVDSLDLRFLVHCLARPSLFQEGVPSCQQADLDQDQDIDLADFDLLQDCVSGSDVPADATCAE